MARKTQPSASFPSFPGAAATVTPSDTVDLTEAAVIYVGTLGNVKVTTTEGTTVTFVGLQAGQVIPVQVIRVWATSTTASNLVAIY